VVAEPPSNLPDASLLSGIEELFWNDDGALDRCGRLLEGELEDLKRADIQYWASLYAWHLDPATSERLASAVTALGHSLGDDRTLARGLTAVARLQLLTEPEGCIKTLDEALPLALNTGQLNLVVVGLCFKAVALMSCGRPAEALVAGEEALRAGEELGWPWGSNFARCAIAQAAVRVGSMARNVRACQGQLQARLGNLVEAYQTLEEAATEVASLTGRRDRASEALLAELSLWRNDNSAARVRLGPGGWQRRVGVGPSAVAWLRAAARLARSDGDPLASLDLASNGLQAAFQAGARLEVVDLLELCGMAFADLGRVLEAARLLGAAAAQRESIGYVRGAPADQELSLVTTSLEATLRPGEFQRACLAGGALSLTEAVNYARRRRGHRDRPVAGWASLSPAERAVAVLVGERLSNQEIAARLLVSTVTVKAHLTRVFAKLGVGNRRELAMMVARRANHENP
jgi:DNA-binding CsgD family transcriptional regulator/tetratricopeptide (TPR) repeat protein